MHPFCWLWGPISIYPALRCCFANASIVAGNVAVCWYLGIFPMEVDYKSLLSLFSLSDLGILWTFHSDCWLQFWWWTRHQVIVQNLQALHPQSSVLGHHSISDPHCRFGSFTFIACNPPFWTLIFNHNPKTCKEDVSGSELGSRRIGSLKHGATPSLIFCSSLIFSNSSEHTLTARGATGTINRHRLRKNPVFMGCSLGFYHWELAELGFFLVIPCNFCLVIIQVWGWTVDALNGDGTLSLRPKLAKNDMNIPCLTSKHLDITRKTWALKQQNFKTMPCWSGPDHYQQSNWKKKTPWMKWRYAVFHHNC